MALPTYYGDGTATVGTGELVVAGTGTSWIANVRENDVFWANGLSVRIEAIGSDGEITLAKPWPGPNLVEAPYEAHITPVASFLTASVLQLLEKLSQGLWLDPDGTGTLAERATYDNARRGFIYMQVDADPFVVFVKLTDADGAWSPGFSPQQGPAGPYADIEVGATTTLAPGSNATVTPTPTSDGVSLAFGLPAGRGFVFRGPYSGAAAYVLDDVVTQNGSTFIALQATTGNTPNPIADTAFWARIATKGVDGAGTGDVVGPALSVDSNIALFDGVTGKLLKDGALGVQSGPLDATANRLLRTGGFGLGSTQPEAFTNGDTIAATGLYRASAEWIGSPFAGVNAANQGTLLHLSWTAAYAVQIHTQIVSAKERRMRVKDNNVWGAWSLDRTTDAAQITSGTFDAGRIPSLDAAKLTSGTLEVARIPATLTPDKAFRRGNVLGPVTEAGGVPTGAIVERGSNANGEYIRFADGTQICWWREYAATLQANVQRQLDYTFAAAFSAVPLVSTSLTTWNNTNSFSITQLAGNAVSPTIGRFRAQATAEQLYTFSLFAIGRWF